MKPDGAKSKFLNVDLDLHGMAGLDRLLAALESDIFVLNDPSRPFLCPSADSRFELLRELLLLDGALSPTPMSISVL